MDFLKGNINKLYFTLLASSLGSTLMTNIYSTVDFVAVGHYKGSVGSAALSCVNPLWPCMLTLGIIAGIGGAVMMNNRRGSGNTDSANGFFTLSMLLSLIAASIVSAGFLLFMKPLLSFFGAEGAILEAALEYSRPIAVVAPTFTLCATASAFVRNDGEAALPTIATVIGGVVNIFGDIFFVFDFGLGLGLFGAGLATALGQLVSFVIIISYFFTKKCKLKFTKIKNVPRKLFYIGSVGASAGITEISFAVTTIIFNILITENLSDEHLAVYGVASTFQILLCCFYYSLGTAAQPLISANFGANNATRVTKTLKTALITAAIMGVVFLAFTELFPTLILKLYMDTSETTLLIGPKIIRLYSLGLPFASISIVAAYYLQSVLRQTMSGVISSLRGIILPVSFALLLPFIFDYNAIWLAVPIAEIITAAVSVIFVICSNKLTKKAQSARNQHS